MTKQSTSWEQSAEWYDELVEEKAGTYQKDVLLPNILRVLSPKKGETVLDLACGQGFFTREFSRSGARAIGADISPSLIAFAKEHSPKAIPFHVAPAHKLGFLKDSSVDAITIIMAIQNIENLGDVFRECTRVLAPGGRIIIVMSHPTFRIPKASDWGYDSEKGIQYRRIDSYMSEAKIKIDMHPGKSGSEQTITFHHPLQVYFKLFSKHVLAVSRLEEWISHKTSAKGPRKAAEDAARKEFPMFMCLEVIKR
jgi:ubiquinone/menaquinone biosynthesis C-methylase UbiE